MSGGVTAFLNEISYNGSGGGSGHSHPGTGTRSIHPNNFQTFTVADIAGETQTALLSIVTGADPFLARYTSSITADLLGDVIVDLTAIADVTLTYSYSAVPEPATVALLLGVGALGFPILRRRANKKKASA